MDYRTALDELYRERRRLDEVIKNLEALVQGKQPPPLSRRGRKSMSEDERQWLPSACANTGHPDARQAIRRTRPLCALKEPEPEVLLTRTVPVAWFKAALVRHLYSINVGERHAEPGIIRRGLHCRIALNLKLE